jgi:hyperosmotically inducible protein
MRTIIRFVLVVAVLAVGAFVLFGWPLPSWRGGVPLPVTAVGTTGTVDTEKARARGAELGEKAAIATQKVKDTAHDAAVTTKIKAKMALDDSVKSRAIDVSTDGATVTLSGTVGSRAEHDRAVSLARETEGVTTVVDRLVVVSR